MVTSPMKPTNPGRMISETAVQEQSVWQPQALTHWPSRLMCGVNPVNGFAQTGLHGRRTTGHPPTE